MSTEDAKPEFEAPSLGDVVRRISGRGEPPFVDPSLLESVREDVQRRPPTEWTEDLAREPFRAYAGLNDSDRASQVVSRASAVLLN